MRIGQIIKEARFEKVINQKTLAKASGISSAYLSLIESSKQDPSLETLEKISVALEVPIYVLLFKAIQEDSIKDVNQKVFVRDIKHSIEKLARTLYEED